MVSNPKRMRYVSDNDLSSSEAETFDDYTRQDGKMAIVRRKDQTRTKWLSKNAIMARENRLKKKLYIANLEKEVHQLKTENTNFSDVVENQSLLITDLKKEIKYLKSVIANSKDIGNLIRNIHHSTGMSVTSSLDQTLSLNDYVSKPKQPIARKTMHPWEETDKQYPSYPTPDSDLFSNDLSDDLLNNIELDEFLGVNNLVTPVEDAKNEALHLEEHNYTSIEDQEDVGVCLHVSKHRVSLEFCSTCSDNALQAWMTDNKL